MKDETKDRLIFFLIGVLIGIVVTVYSGVQLYRFVKGSGFERTEKASTQSKKESKVPARKEFYLSFENNSDMDMLSAEEGTKIERVSANATQGKSSLMATFPSGGKYPGLLWEVYGGKAQNWKGFSKFHMDIYNNSEEYVRLEIKFKSGKKYPKKSYTHVVELEPLKSNSIDIPISSIANSCDISKMSYIKIFMKSPGVNTTLYLDNMGTK